MTEQWYYSLHNEQRGPVAPAELLALETSGLINDSTLVWKTGMSSWQPWSKIAAEVRAGVSASGGEESAVCVYSGETRPISQMVRYGNHYVAIEHKDAFVQSLAEGARVSHLPGVSEVQPVGFWWRVLGLIIDGICLMVPSMLFNLPYYILSFQQGFREAQAGGGTPSTSMNPFAGMGGVMLLAYIGGQIGSWVFSAAYETWMTGKYGGTVGKLLLGLRVVKVDGSKLGYGRAFGRWAAKLLNYIIWGALVFIPVGLIGFFAAANGGDPSWVFVAFVVGLLLWLVGGFGFYMAGWTKRKQALHDLIAKTLVVRKNPY